MLPPSHGAHFFAVRPTNCSMPGGALHAGRGLQAFDVRVLLLMSDDASCCHRVSNLTPDAGFQQHGPACLSCLLM